MADENKPHFYVITYDIPADRRRTKVATALEDYGSRVQYSVFEANLTAAQFDELRQRLKKLVKPEEDSVRYYRLCAACLGTVLIDGRGQVASDPEVYIV
jgi:CRISPR-associated protein Cas2